MLRPETLQLLLFIGGLAHLALLAAALQVPFVLDWRRALAGLDPFLRRLFWVYGAFITLTILSFGAVSLLFAGELAGGQPLARGVCAMIGIFWTARLAVQLFVFDAKPILRHWFHKAGYHALTVLFLYLSIAYLAAAAV